MSHSTDLRKLLSEARDKISHEKDCAFIRVGLLKCTCYHQDLYNRIDAALAKPVEPVAWIQPDHLAKARKAAFLCRVEPKQRDDFIPLYAAPADQ